MGFLAGFEVVEKRRPGRPRKNKPEEVTKAPVNEIPKNFTYLDSFVLPREMKPSKRRLNEYITEANRWKYFLELKDRRDTIDLATYKEEDFPAMRIIYILYWVKDGKYYILKIGQTQKCHQRIGSNYLKGDGANTGWLSPALYEFLNEKGGEIEIYYRAFDGVKAEQEDDIIVNYTPRLDEIEKHYQNLLGVKDGKKAIQEFFNTHNFSYIIPEGKDI